MIKKIGYIITLIIAICLFVSCSSDEVLTISVHNLDNKTFVMGEEINFDDAYITIVYKDGSTSDIPLTGANINASDLYNAFSSIGTKTLNVFYEDNEGNIFNCETSIIVVENTYKSEYKIELQNYKSDVLYNDEAKKQVNNIKISYSIMIASASKEDALTLLNLAKAEIDNIMTKAEEDSYETIQELSNEIKNIKTKLNTLINYEDSLIKDEINALDRKIDDLKEEVDIETVNEEIANIKLSLSALEANVNNIKANVEKNNKLILSLTETINEYMTKFVTKTELESKLNEVQEAYETAIEVALNEQQMIVEMRVNGDYIEYRYNNSTTYEKLISISELKGETIEEVMVEESGAISLRLKNGTSLVTDKKVSNNLDIETSNITNEELEKIITTIKEYFNLYYNMNNYDYTSVETILGDYYQGYVSYVELTEYDVLSDVQLIYSELDNYLSSEFLINSESFRKIFKFENRFMSIDSNLNICKAYFGTLLSTANIDEYQKEAFINRILVTNSIESAIELYEQAIN